MFRVASSGQGDQAGVSVTVAEGETVRVDLRERERGVVTGRVTEGGSPVPRVQVSLTREGGVPLPFLSDLSAESGEDGRYRIEGVEAGRFTLFAKKSGAPVPAEVPVDAAGGETVVDVELPRGVIEGRILDAAGGRGLAGAEVHLSKEEKKEGGERLARTSVVSLSVSGSSGRAMQFRMSGGGESVRTDIDGKFRLEGIPAGLYALSASLDGYADGRRGDLSMPRDGALSGIDLSLGKGGKIRGTVTDASGSPVPFSVVEVRPAEGEPKRGVTAMDGTYEVGGLGAGVYEVSVRRPGRGEPGARQPGVRVEAGRETALDLQTPG